MIWTLRESSELFPSSAACVCVCFCFFSGAPPKVVDHKQRSVFLAFFQHRSGQDAGLLQGFSWSPLGMVFSEHFRWRFMSTCEAVEFIAYMAEAVFGPS